MLYIYLCTYKNAPSKNDFITICRKFSNTKFLNRPINVVVSISFKIEFIYRQLITYDNDKSDCIKEYVKR